MSMRGTPYYDMALDSGYRGSDAEEMAQRLEWEHQRLEWEHQREEEERRREEEERRRWLEEQTCPACGGDPETPCEACGRPEREAGDG